MVAHTGSNHTVSKILVPDAPHEVPCPRWVVPGCPSGPSSWVEIFKRLQAMPSPWIVFVG